MNASNVKNISVAVAVCSRNRADQLANCLSSILAQKKVTISELLIVDNDSCDGTQQLLSKFIDDKHLNVRTVIEKNIGIAFARNRAIKEVCSDYIAFIDDDAQASDLWLYNLILPLVDSSVSNADIAAVAGRVMIDWNGPRPNWFPEEYLPLYCEFDKGVRRRRMRAEEYFLTTNLLIRTSMLREMGGFNTQLGRRDKSLLGGEDNNLFNRLIACNARIVYVPDAVVRHVIVKERKTIKHFMRLVWSSGCTVPLLDRIQHKDAGISYKRFFRIRHELKVMISCAYQCLTFMIIGKNKEAFKSLADIFKSAGRVYALAKFL